MRGAEIEVGCVGGWGRVGVGARLLPGLRSGGKRLVLGAADKAGCNEEAGSSVAKTLKPAFAPRASGTGPVCLGAGDAVALN